MFAPLAANRSQGSHEARCSCQPNEAGLIAVVVVAAAVVVIVVAIVIVIVDHLLFLTIFSQPL